jgi:hypothetical protein
MSSLTIKGVQNFREGGGGCHCPKLAPVLKDGFPLLDIEEHLENELIKLS